MGRIVTIIQDVTTGNVNGLPIQANNGDLVLAPRGSVTIKVSSNGGVDWTNVYDLPSGLTRLNYVDNNGNIYIGTESGSGNNTTSIYRSGDNGQTWSEVLGVESSASWKIVETSDEILYLSEYSTGSRDAFEKYGYNVWKSINNGINWTKFYSHTPQSIPGAKDSIRHIHLLAVDSEDNLYISFGESGWGIDGGKTYKLNSDGTLGDVLVSYGNGLISFVEADDGIMFFGTDVSPNKIIKYDKQRNIVNDVIIIDTEFDSLGTDVFDIDKGKDGVLYALCHGITGQQLFIIASDDDGKTWVKLNVTTLSGSLDSGQHLTINRNVENSRVYIGRSVAPYLSFPDYTRAELKALYTSTLTINGQ